MTLIEKINMIERVHLLIKRRGTGSPKELASRLDVSERCVYSLLSLMKEMGAPISFCNNKNSYCYDYKVDFSIGFVQEEGLKVAKGGKNFADFFQLQEWCSVPFYISSQNAHSRDILRTL